MWVNSQEPDFEAKMTDIVGLYLNPPENALVLSVDEKTSIQAFGKKHPPQPMEPENQKELTMSIYVMEPNP